MTIGSLKLKEFRTKRVINYVEGSTIALQRSWKVIFKLSLDWSEAIWFS